MKKETFEFKVIAKGRSLEEHSDERGNVWVPANRGDSFQLKVSNHSEGRVMAVCSVDGLCVMTGEVPEDGRLRGYIVKPGAAMLVPGWRLDDDHIAEFEFTESAKSYAAQMGRKNEKQGQLICEIFYEKPPPPKPKPPAEIAEVEEDMAFAPPEGTALFTPQELPDGPDLPNTTYSLGRMDPQTPGGGDATGDNVLRSSGAGELESMFGEPDNVGVGFGKKAEHKTNTVDFKVDGSVPPVRFVIRYDTARGLQRRGVGCAIPPMWSSHPGNRPSTSQIVGDLARFNRDAERRRKEAESKGLGARLKKWFGG